MYILDALVAPVLAEFAIMKPAQQVRVVIQPVGGTQHLVKVMAVIACRGFLVRARLRTMRSSSRPSSTTLASVSSRSIASLSPLAPSLACL